MNKYPKFVKANQYLGTTCSIYNKDEILREEQKKMREK